MAKSEKSKAEIYREERKARISSSTKKMKKRNSKHPKLKKIIGSVFLVILAVAVVGAATWGILDTTGVIARNKTAFSIGKYDISVAEYSYMYYMQYNNLVNTSYQYYSYYGYNVYGFDYNSSPEEQESTYQDEDGNKLLWSERLVDQTVEYMQEFYTLYDEAIAAGYTVDEDEQADIDKNIEELRTKAAGTDSTSTDSQTPSISLSLNSYLKNSYGKGINENFLRKMMAREAITQKFSEAKQQEFEDTYTNDALDKEYAKDKDAYDAVNLRTYSFAIEKLTAKDGESEEALAERQKEANAAVKAEADAFLKEATDESSFIKAADAVEAAKKTATEDKTATDETAATEEEYDGATATKSYYKTKSALTSSISEDAAKWIFADGRKAGNKQVFETETAYQVVYVVKTQYPLPSVDARHILFMTVDSQSGEALAEDKIAEAKAQSEKVLSTWQNSKTQTEEYFGELANQYSEDTGSNENGGLYEGIVKGSMVTAFDNWIFNKDRKAGDVELVESEYGYHIIYYIGNPSYDYRNTLRTNHVQDDYSGWLEEQIGLDTYKLVKNAANMQEAYDRTYVLIDKYVSQIQSQANAAA